MLTRAAKKVVIIHVPIICIHVKIIIMICPGVSLLQFTNSGAQVSQPYFLYRVPCLPFFVTYILFWWRPQDFNGNHNDQDKSAELGLARSVGGKVGLLHTGFHGLL